MIAAVSGPLLDLARTLPAHGGGASVGSLAGHAFFGAGFLFVGSLLVVETLAGPVWSRERLRTMAWPAALMLAGVGMLIVAHLQPNQKAVHLTLAILLLLGGLFEARYRVGDISRAAADAFAIPALIVAGIVVGPMHANAPLFQSAAADTHLLVGVMGFVLAGIRLTQIRWRPTAALDATFGVGVMALGMSLLIAQQFHAGHH